MGSMISSLLLSYSFYPASIFLHFFLLLELFICCLSRFMSLSCCMVGPLLSASWSSRLTCLKAYLKSNSLDLHSIRAKMK